MRKFFLFVLTFMIGIFLQGSVSARIDMRSIPSETIVITLPNDSVSKWKAISGFVSGDEGLIELIPYDQNKENWTGLIAIQYFNKAIISKKVGSSLESIMNQLKKTTLNSYPKNTVKWAVIEKNKADVIYEWILTKPHKHIPPQHEICRAFLTNTSFHRIGFTKRGKEMNQDERNYWIKLFRESTDVFSIEAARSLKEGLSLAENKLPSI